MQKNNSAESGLFNPRLFVAFALSSLAALLGLLSFAASPSSGTLSPGNPTITYTGGPFTIPTNATDSATGPVTCNAAAPCDDFALTIDIPQSYKDANPDGFVKIEVSWIDPSGQQDLDIFLTNNPDSGPYPAHGANGTGKS